MWPKDRTCLTPRLFIGRSSPRHPGRTSTDEDRRRLIKSNGEMHWIRVTVGTLKRELSVPILAEQPTKQDSLQPLPVLTTSFRRRHASKELPGLDQIQPELEGQNWCV